MTHTVPAWVSTSITVQQEIFLSVSRCSHDTHSASMGVNIYDSILKPLHKDLINPEGCKQGVLVLLPSLNVKTNKVNTVISLGGRLRFLNGLSNSTRLSPYVGKGSFTQSFHFNFNCFIPISHTAFSCRSEIKQVLAW